MTRLPTTAGLPQPQSSPSVTARTIRPTAAPSTSEPARSGSLPLCRSPRGSRSAAAASATPRGTLTRKRARQSSSLDKCPADHRPGHGGHRRRRGPHAECGHPPLRRTVRQHDAERRRDHRRRARRPGRHAPASSTSTLGASAAASEAAVNTVTPPTKRVRRPRTSASRPRGASAAANATAYSETTQDRVSRPASRIVDGQARDGEVRDGDVDEGQEGAAAGEQQRQPGGRGKGHGTSFSKRSFVL